MASAEFTPRLDILPPPQRRLWEELGETPPEFTLYGGTAIALQLGHRQSHDFDFFGREKFDPDRLRKSIKYLAKGEIVQREEDTLSMQVDRGGPVFLSFFGLPALGQIARALVTRDNGLKIASLLDLAGCKADVIQKRAKIKDYADYDALIAAGVTIAESLSAAKVIFGDAFEPAITIRALSYFDDGELKTMDRLVKERLTKAVRATNIFKLPELNPVRRHVEERAE